MDTVSRLRESFGKPVVTPEELAGLLGCHPSHVRSLCRSGQVRATRLGARWLIPLSVAAKILDGVWRVEDVEAV